MYLQDLRAHVAGAWVRLAAKYFDIRITGNIVVHCYAAYQKHRF